MIPAVAPPHLYVDIDDVLAETTRALAELARSHFGKTVDFEAMHSFDLGVSLGLDHAELSLFMEAAHQPDFLRALAPIEGAQSALDAWHEAGAEIHVVTGRPPDSRPCTEAWLSAHGIRHHRLELVDKYGRYPGSRSVRKEHLIGRRYHFVIEDSADMARFLAEGTGAQVLLFDRPWNRGAGPLGAGITRVHSWTEIRRHVHTCLP
jgi:uncharacterized HAD superfamily protein